jgi:hypothetical protein
MKTAKGPSLPTVAPFCITHSVIGAAHATGIYLSGVHRIL